MAQEGITPIVMPKWGLEMREGTIGAWLVEEGTRIAVGQPILDVETDKISNAVEAPDAGLCRLRMQDGSALLGVNVNGLGAGHAAVGCVRPERIRLLARGAAAANGVAARITSLIYFGDHVRVRCVLPNSDECFVKLTLNDPALPGLSEGTPVALEIEPSHLRVFI